MGSYRGIELAELTLTGPRLTLRPWGPGDADAVHRAMQDHPMHEFLVLPDPYTHADAVQYVTGLGNESRADGTGLGCAVVHTATGRLVGSAALRLPGRRGTAAEIGYWIAPDARGSGYAAEATRILADWAFGVGVHRVELRCAVGNLASAHTALAAGLRFDAVLRGAGRTSAGPTDDAIFARLAGDSADPLPPVFTALPDGGLTDGVLRLRVLCPDDVDAMLDEAADPLVRGWGFGDAARGRAELAEIAAAAALQWLVGPVARLAMVDVQTGQTAGSLQVRLPGPPQVAGIGYAVRAAFRGRGFTARALRLLVPWAFGPAGFVRLELGAKQDNLASQKAALAAGFEPDGVRRSRLRNPDGTFSDEVRFALLARQRQRPQSASRISP